MFLAFGLLIVNDLVLVLSLKRSISSGKAKDRTELVSTLLIISNIFSTKTLFPIRNPAIGKKKSR